MKRNKNIVVGVIILVMAVGVSIFIYYSGGLFFNRNITETKPKTELTCYHINSDKVYWHGDESVVSGADPLSFTELLGWNPINGCYAKDKNHVFFNTSIVAGADVKSFHLIDEFYGIDINNVYYASLKIPNVSPKTFKYLGSGFGEDKNIIYDYQPGLADDGSDNGVLNIIKTDPKNFVIYDWYYSKDANYVYYGGRIIKGADSKTFIMVDDSTGLKLNSAGRYYDSRDKNNYYRNGKVVK